MTVDLRHWGWCSLGPLAPQAPATLADDHIQRVGVCMTKGTITLEGIYRPAAGSPVSLAYGDGVNWVARVPRRLRVLSSSADPMRNITTLSVGCLLAYHENRRPPVDSLKETDQNGTVPEAVRRVAALPMTSAWVAQQILTTLGLTVAGSIPLTIARVVDSWDMTSGYVEELGRLADSEGYFCRINESEQVEFVSKRQELGIGPLLQAAQISDLSPINVGDLPGESVYAKYNSLRLNPPPNDLTEEQISERNWESERVNGGGVQAIHTYTDAAGQTIKEFIVYNDWSRMTTSYDQGDRVSRREERSSSLNGVKIARTRFNYGSGIGSSEDFADVREEIYEEWGPEGDIAAACGKNAPHFDFKTGERYMGWRVTTYDKSKLSGITKTTTRNATLYINTPHGADAIARLRDAGDEPDSLIGSASKLVPYGSSVRIRTERQFGLQRRPGQQERNREALQKVPEIEQTTKTVWALGSPSSQVAIELSPPYVSDDHVAFAGNPPTYSVMPGNAQQQALAYATTENRLLLGNRNGIGLQLSPLDAPPRPFDLFYVRLAGCTAAYRANGTTWTIGADGIRVTIDALFWGAIDGVLANAWFPLPPGLTTLPGAAAVTTNANPRPANAINIPAGFDPTHPDLGALFAALPTGVAAVPAATISPTVLIPPYVETLTLRGGIRIGGWVRDVLTPEPTVQLGGGVRVGAMLREVSLRAGGAVARLVPGAATLTVTGAGGGGAALILHMDGPGFVDSSSNAAPVTVYGATISTAQSMFGGASGLFNGVDSYIETVHSSFAVGFGSWTLGAWVYPLTTSEYRNVFAFGGAFGAGLGIENNMIGWRDIGQIHAVKAILPNQWSYVEVSKEGSTLRVFVNGIKATSDFTVESFWNTSNLTYETVVIGGGIDSYDPFDGYIDDVFLLPGQALHTANFTPPTGPYPNP